MNGGRSALILQHDDDAGPGLLDGWLRARGFAVHLVSAPLADALPDPWDHGLVVVLGSEHSAADDDLGWLARELRLVGDAHRLGIPTLGICFGGQLLARALGGTVFPDRAAEIGWRTIESARPDVVSPGPWFEWHFDVFEPPPAAEVIATSRCGVEAFAYGSAVGLQFHPEVDRSIVAGWAAGPSPDLARAGVESVALHDGIGETPLRARAWALFDAIGKHLGAVGGDRRA
ncbi:MAG: type 1 glutamine amidotransferase [Solirubrobacterales bacterium]